MENTGKLFRQYLAQTSPSPLGLEVARADGIYLYTPDGERVTDLISGVSVSVVGHSHPAVVEAVRRQAGEYMHTMVYGETVQRPQVEYARRLCSFLPDGLQSVFFVNSGAEAIEGAIKLAKRATGRREMAAFRRAYHGSTHGALSLMSSPEGDEWRRAFEPLLPEVKWLIFNELADLTAITERTACVVVEPVQGEAGVQLPTPNFLVELRRRCDATGTLLVFDEIQTGMGRCGGSRSEPAGAPSCTSSFESANLFAFQKYGVEPDILCLAKALGGGLPLGAFVASRDIMSTLSHSPALGHITTFGGNPVCCAAGLAALNVLTDNDLPLAVEAKGALFESLLAPHPRVKEIRRAGLLIAVELGQNVEKLIRKFLRNGILSDWFLFCDTAFRISPPLTITDAEIRETCAKIIKCLDEPAQTDTK